MPSSAEQTRAGAGGDKTIKFMKRRQLKSVKHQHSPFPHSLFTQETSYIPWMGLNGACGKLCKQIFWGACWFFSLYFDCLGQQKGLSVSRWCGVTAATLNASLGLYDADLGDATAWGTLCRLKSNQMNSFSLLLHGDTEEKTKRKKLHSLRRHDHALSESSAHRL